jgi:hypothetical protein
MVASLTSIVRELSHTKRKLIRTNQPYLLEFYEKESAPLCVSLIIPAPPPPLI